MLTFANKYDNITKLSRGDGADLREEKKPKEKVRKKFLTRRTEADIINRLSRKKRAKRLEKNQKKALDKKGWT